MIIITAHTWVKWSNNNISARTRHLLWRLYCFKMSNDKHSRFIHLKSYSKAVLRGKAKIFLLFWHHNVKARFWNHKRREFLILNQNSVLCCYFTLTTVTFYLYVNMEFCWKHNSIRSTRVYEILITNEIINKMSFVRIYVWFYLKMWAEFDVTLVFRLFMRYEYSFCHIQAIMLVIDRFSLCIITSHVFTYSVLVTKTNEH